uniref:tetratricopeptide repeat protein n=1 Tax=Flavobacterium sp. TaxID=239 RepID=UPI00404A5251
MRNFIYQTTFITLFGLSYSHAQKTAIYTNDLKDFYRAVELFKDEQFQSAQQIFMQVQRENKQHDVLADCAYYIAISAVKLNQGNADVLMEHFIAEYPTSSKLNQAYWEVAQFYFKNRQYPFALEWLEKVNLEQLTLEEKDRFYFQKGYVYFDAKNLEPAKENLMRVVNSPEFGSQADYYLGVINYEGDNYTEASQYFDRVGDNEKYKEKMAYFQADMNFKLGNFDKSIELSKAAMPKATAIEKSELNKIIGESYFNQQKYAEAIPYLKEYKGKKGKWTNTDFYLLGYAYYKQNDFENALMQFNKIIDGSDFVAQNAYYHLGESYLKTNRKPEALSAFKNASEMEFDLKIKEDAALNYAKLSYEIGNPYESVPTVLSNFLNTYPNTPNKQEIETLLINSYITSKNYREALVLLEKNKSFANKVAYQKVTFYRGLELYTDGNYKEALEMFNKSLSEPRDPKFTARATFWKAETEFGSENFQEALISFKQFQNSAEAKNTPEFKNLNYNIGYAYFKLKDYDQAAQAFEKYVATEKKDVSRLNDSYLRLGDSQFVTAKYWPAMEAYNKAIDMKGIDADYAAYQKAISYGFVQRTDSKIDDLKAFLTKYPKSQYRDDALYELANTYSNQAKNDLAITTYDQLIKEFNNSSFTARSILRQGLIFYNSNKAQPALIKFKKVVADFPGSPESVEAVSTARQIYVDAGNVEEYSNWVKTLDFVEVTDTDLDNTTYESAEKMYLQNNKKGATTGFLSYVTKFPNGIHALKANFYLAQLYFSDDLENNAIEHYEYVIAKNRSEFTEQALARLSEIYLKKKDYGNGIPVLKRLETEADFPQNITFAQSNLMKAYYEQLDFANAELYADKVLANPKIEDRVRNDAQTIIARSAIKTKNEAKAREWYGKLLKSAKGELAAEAHYYDAFFKNKDGNFKESNEVVNKIIKEFPSYRYYFIKSLIIKAKNDYSLNDAYSALVLLDALVEQSKEYPDILEEAQKLQTEYKNKEAERNASIQNQPTTQP